MGVLLRNSGVQLVWGLWKNKYLKKGIAYCTSHITPLFSRSYKCLTVEHVPSDFRHLEERFKVCWRHALWGAIFPRAAYKYEPELPVGANQHIFVWENAWNASEVYKGRHNIGAQIWEERLLGFHLLLIFSFLGWWNTVPIIPGILCVTLSPALALAVKLFGSNLTCCRSLRRNILSPDHRFKRALFHQV